MSDGTVRRWVNYKGMMEESTNGKFILASDYDALRTQARELAKSIIAHIGQEPEPFLTVSQCSTASECVRLNDRIQTANIIRDQAQAVLKEGA